MIVGHTRWESADISWAGITLRINQSSGQFTRSDQELPRGFSAAAGDVDGDGDADLLILDEYEREHPQFLTTCYLPSGIWHKLSLYPVFYTSE